MAHREMRWAAWRHSCARPALRSRREWVGCSLCAVCHIQYVSNVYRACWMCVRLFRRRYAFAIHFRSFIALTHVRRRRGHVRRRSIASNHGMCMHKLTYVVHAAKTSERSTERESERVYRGRKSAQRTVAFDTRVAIRAAEKPAAALCCKGSWCAVCGGGCVKGWLRAVALREAACAGAVGTRCAVAVGLVKGHREHRGQVVEKS